MDFLVSLLDEFLKPGVYFQVELLRAHALSIPFLIFSALLGCGLESLDAPAVGRRPPGCVSVHI